MRHRGRVIAASLLGAVVVAGGTASALRITATPPAPVVRVSVPSSYVPVPGKPTPVQQPPQGALALQGDGKDIALLDADTPRPIASVAKTMTALEVLRAHPLQDKLDEGPVLTMTDVDVADYKDTIRKDGSSLPVVAGERLTERQMLLGLLLPSANNFADTLGRWVSGSVPAFVDQLNASAQRLGMVHSHFADPSGFDVATVASASDLVLLGKAVLDSAPLSALVATQEAKLPDGSDLVNLDSLLGAVPGWLGIKTGSTPQAGGCLLFAARRDIGASAPVTMVGAVLGQTDLHAALDAARTAVETGYRGFDVIHPSAAPIVNGDVTTAWETVTGVHVRAGSSSGGIAVRVGTVVQLTTHVSGTAAGAAADSNVALIDGAVDGHAGLHWTVVLDSVVPRPSAWWMLLHG